MPDHVRFSATLAALLGAGLIAGVFFAFSSFVMPALRRLPPADGAAAMQTINVVVINPLFLGVFVGTAILSAAAIVDSALRWDRPGAAWLLAGGLLYLVGAFGVTIVGNVPLNNRLALLDVASTNAATEWATFYARWMVWNHLRTIAATLATAAYAISLRA
jgi:uncharacterized membrane protein